jgi:hypothetical protein
MGGGLGDFSTNCTCCVNGRPNMDESRGGCHLEGSQARCTENAGPCLRNIEQKKTVTHDVDRKNFVNRIGDMAAETDTTICA